MFAGAFSWFFFGHAKKNNPLGLRLSSHYYSESSYNMIITRAPFEIRQQLQPLRGKNTIAFVPTMGCLHQGHLSLIETAKTLANIVVVSIYVNPLQFGPGEDLEHYPRPFETDARLCRDAGVDFIFHPPSLYPESGAQITLNVSKLSNCLCGASRPDHFDGVATVVNILFNIIQPDFAIFGEKDWQQLTIIRQMVNDLAMPIEVIGAATMRQADGLAMSSRNRYLSDDERQQALAISQALTAMQQQAATGESDVETLKNTALSLLKQAGISPQYIEILNATSLTGIDTLDHHDYRAFIAARVGNMPIQVMSAQTISTQTMPKHSKLQEQHP